MYAKTLIAKIGEHQSGEFTVAEVATYQRLCEKFSTYGAWSEIDVALLKKALIRVSDGH